jgi:ABC-type sugar transport system substrate-binding protein
MESSKKAVEKELEVTKKNSEKDVTKREQNISKAERASSTRLAAMETMISREVKLIIIQS